MTKCSGITQAGTACKGIPIGVPSGAMRTTQTVPTNASRTARRAASAGAGAVLSQSSPGYSGRFEELADKVLAGELVRTSAP